MAIAQQHAVEIVSVDSALVYRGMDIGTAKPTPAELAATAHHLINIRDPLQAYSAAEFARDARALIKDITARGKLALLVGGSMLYFKALRDGLDAMPGADPTVRAVLEQEARQQGWPALHAALALVDPVTAARLKPADGQRIARALEVYRLTGQPLSSFHTTKTIAANAGQTGVGGLSTLDFSARQDALIALEPQDRSWLQQRIAQRFEAMLANGFVDEVKALRARGDLHADLPAMRCVGYRQAWQALEGLSPMGELRDKGVFATRQLAKRQLTWLRSMPERQVVACDAPDALDRVLALAQAFTQHLSMNPSSRGPQAAAIHEAMDCRASLAMTKQP
jgi:tRNA dimethylallyltransferase